jgi:hypothetical protein
VTDRFRHLLGLTGGIFKYLSLQTTRSTITGIRSAPLAMSLNGLRVFDLSGGRPMKGWLVVGPEATKTAKGLSE